MPESWLVRMARHVGLDAQANRLVQRYRSWQWDRRTRTDRWR